MPGPEVTLIVLTYDGRDLLAATFESITGQRADADVRIVVVDNGSTDGTKAWLHEAWPAVEVIRLEENIGVAAALNRGIAGTGGEFVALLNNDVELADGWLDILLDALRAAPEAVCATGKLRRYDERDRIDTAGDVLLRSGAAVNRGAGQIDRGQYDRPEIVFGACAGAALYRRWAFTTVGPFEETYFAYLEDVDWAMRAQLIGARTLYQPSAVGFHMGGATTKRRKGYYGRLQRRNQILLVVQTFPARTLVRHGWRILGCQLLALAGSARDGMLTLHLQAWTDAVRMLPAALRRRRALQRGRRVPVDGIERLMVAGLPDDAGRAGRLLFELAPATAQQRAARR